jgi:DNA uptake protein ComE-like DNA-binding protein
MRRHGKWIGVFLAAVVLALGMHVAAVPALAGQSGGASVDLNHASEKDLEALPGVGAATAKKIIAGRPYSSAADLSKAGVSAATIKKITPLVTVGGAAQAPAAAAASKAAAPPKQSAPSQGGGLVDLNSASAKELNDLPGVREATTKKIIAGRPYSSVSDLSKAGVSASTISKITPLVTVGNASAASSSPRSAPAPKPAPAAATPPASTPPPAPAASPATAAAPPPAAPARASTAAAQGSPGNGMVWVNTETGVYHKEGSRFYGKTKTGKYMSVADAEKAGYRAAKNNE